MHYWNNAILSVQGKGHFLLGHKGNELYIQTNITQYVLCTISIQEIIVYSTKVIIIYISISVYAAIHKSMHFPSENDIYRMVIVHK
jgi:hypothetical protein